MITGRLVYESHYGENEAGMRFNPKARIDRSGTERRGRGGGTGIGGGQLTIGGVVALGLVFLIGQVTGVDVSGLIPETGSGSSTVADSCRTGADANASDDCAIALITTSVQNYWDEALPAQAGIAYQRIKTVRFDTATTSACGRATAATGPFYCPSEQRVYLDTGFVDDMLTGDLGARGGAFALAYVIGHEYGHHIENQLGYLDRIRTRQGERSDSVKVELMADCLGGMWARAAQDVTDQDGNRIIENLTRDDIARAIDAARAVGDDRIHQSSGGSVNSEAWTHGSSAQREHWFNVGLTEGSLQACDTFAPGALG